VHWPLYTVLVAFTASLALVPVFADVTISDDWTYMRSVRILVEEARLDVHPLVAAHLVFQVLWAAPFGLVFGVTPGVMRLSMAVLWLLSGIPPTYSTRWATPSRSHS
jgi:hypothetical protein